MKKLLFFLSTFSLSVIGFTYDVHAVALKLAPLEYRTTLKTGESKKGFIDISNPSTEKLIVTSSVQAFRQTDDTGALQFFDNDQLKAGIKLDLDSFELGPKEAVRMYFLIDGKLLPTGDVYGGIFFTTKPVETANATAQSVKLGTILSIVNGTPGDRKAELTSLSAPSFMFDNQINGTYTVKNTGNPKTSTGFYPQVSIRVWPFGKEKIQTGKLVFAGRSRENSFKAQTPPFGVYRVEAAYGASTQARWVVVAHPLAIIGLVIATLGLLVLLKLRKRRKMARTSSFTSR